MSALRCAVDTDPPGWLCTGLQWFGGQPRLGLLLGERPVSVGLVEGLLLSVRLTGPRRCVGIAIRQDAEQLPCPRDALASPHARDSMCPTCIRVNAWMRGHRRDEPGEWELYLGWAARGRIQVGIAPNGWGIDNALGRGYLSYSLVSTGPYATVLRAAATLKAAGVTCERVAAIGTVMDWWRLPPARLRAQQLTAARREACAIVRAVYGGVVATPPEPVDLAPLYWLDHLEPDPRLRVVISLTEGTILAGEVRQVIGTRLLLATDTELVLINVQRMAGWTLHLGHGDISGVGFAPFWEAT